MKNINILFWNECLLLKCEGNPNYMEDIGVITQSTNSRTSKSEKDLKSKSSFKNQALVTPVHYQPLQRRKLGLTRGSWVDCWDSGKIRKRPAWTWSGLQKVSQKCSWRAVTIWHSEVTEQNLRDPGQFMPLQKLLRETILLQSYLRICIG